MAQTDRFYFWRAFYDALMMLDNDTQRGEFVRGMCQWAFDGVQPTFSDRMLQFGFTNIRDQIAESISIGRVARETGKRGGRPKKTPPLTDPKTVPETEGNGSDLSTASPDAPNVASGSPPDEHERESNGWYAQNGIEPPPMPAPPEGGGG